MNKSPLLTPIFINGTPCIRCGVRNFPLDNSIMTITCKLCGVSLSNKKWSMWVYVCFVEEYPGA